MNMKRIVIFASLLLAFWIQPFLRTSFVNAETAATAQQEHQEAASPETEGGTVEEIGRWFNFLLLVAILYLFLKRNIKIDEKFKADAELIQSSIESARIAKDEAEKRLAEMEQRMATINEEVEKVKAETARQAEEERKQILESAQREAEKIVLAAQREVDSELRLARKKLRKHLADLSVAQGRKIIETEINDQDQSRLINDYIEDLGK
jgi:F-type H+-transporting ATPase subunit b